MSASTGLITTVAGGGTDNAVNYQRTGDGTPRARGYTALWGSRWTPPETNCSSPTAALTRCGWSIFGTDVISTVAGGGSCGAGYGGGAASATLSDPTGLAVDANGNMYIVDSGQGLIYEVTGLSGQNSPLISVSPAGVGMANRIAGPGHRATLSDPGPGPCGGQQRGPVHCRYPERGCAQSDRA